MLVVVVFFLLTLKEVPRQRQRVAQVAIAADEYVGRLLPEAEGQERGGGRHLHLLFTPSS